MESPFTVLALLKPLEKWDGSISLGDDPQRPAAGRTGLDVDAIRGGPSIGLILSHQVSEQAVRQGLHACLTGDLGFGTALLFVG